MDIDEAKAYAAEYTIDSLCSGREFKGLGSLAKYLVIAVAGPADENAKHTSKYSSRTPEKFQEMKTRVSQDFVLSVCGLSDERRTPVEAAHHLVHTVWWAYIDWAKEGDAAMARLKEADGLEHL